MARNGQNKLNCARGPQHIRSQPASSYAGAVYSQSQSSQIYGHHGPSQRSSIMYHARSFDSGLGTYVSRIRKYLHLSLKSIAEYLLNLGTGIEVIHLMTFSQIYSNKVYLSTKTFKKSLKLYDYSLIFQHSYLFSRFLRSTHAYANFRFRQQN